MNHFFTSPKCFLVQILMICKQRNHSQIASMFLILNTPATHTFFLFNTHEVIPDTYQEHALKCFRTTKVLARRLSASSDLEIQFSRNEKKPPLDRGALKMCTFKVLHKLGTSCLAQHHSSLKVGVCDNH